MDRKVSNYLNNKNKIDYTCLDNILSFYHDGHFSGLLLDNDFTQIEFFPSIRKNGNSIQINLNYYELCAILEFREEYYEYCVYKRGYSVEALKKSITKELYHSKFDIEIFMEHFIKSIKNDARLSKSNSIEIDGKNKKKLHVVISTISMLVPVFVITLFAICVYVFGEPIRLNWWFLFVITIPLIVWFGFDIKSKK